MVPVVDGGTAVVGAEVSVQGTPGCAEVGAGTAAGMAPGAPVVVVVLEGQTQATIPSVT